MQFIYLDRGGEESLQIDGDEYNYLFKVRRHKKDRPLFIRDRNKPEMLYQYSIENIDRRRASLKLISATKSCERPKKNLTVGWCVVDSKTIEKTLPMINELGVTEVVFIYCQYSQKDIEIDFERFSRVLESSSMQSGRFDTPKLRVLNSVAQFLLEFPNSIAIDFSEEKLKSCQKDSISLLVGAEGGFSEKERESFQRVAGLTSPYILRSQTALISAISIATS